MQKQNKKTRKTKGKLAKNFLKKRDEAFITRNSSLTFAEWTFHREQDQKKKNHKESKKEEKKGTRVQPGRMGETMEPMRTPSGNQRCMASPMMRPKAAPILKMGISTPDGTGSVEARIVSRNCKNRKRNRTSESRFCP